MSHFGACPWALLGTKKPRRAGGLARIGLASRSLAGLAAAANACAAAGLCLCSERQVPFRDALFPGRWWNEKAPPYGRQGRALIGPFFEIASVT